MGNIIVLFMLLVSTEYCVDVRFGSDVCYSSFEEAKKFAGGSRTYEKLHYKIEESDTVAFFFKKLLSYPEQAVQ